MTKVDSTEAFLRMLDKGELPAVVAFGGPERIFVDDALVSLRARVLSGGLADFNHDRTSARERRGVEVVALCNTLPVMAPRRLVEVRDADDFGEADVEALSAYLARPCRETVLCLVVSDVDERGRLARLLIGSTEAIVCRFGHPQEREMPGLVAARARRLNVTLQPGAADALTLTVGNDITMVERALEKLSLAVEGPVSVDDVGRHVADTHMEDAYAWVRAIATADRAGALRATAALQAARDEPVRLLGLLAWQLRQVAQARALLDEGRDAARELRLYGDRAGPVLQAARAFDPARHAARIVRVAEADRALKSSRQPPWLQMVRLVQELTLASTSTKARQPSA